MDHYARVIWDYMQLHQLPEKADAILALGSNDIRIADRAAELYHQGYAPYIICSGGIAHVNDVNATGWDVTEAEMYKRRLVELGVPDEKIILETEATNAGENARFTKSLIEKNDLQFKKLLLVHKPFMERRTYATFKRQWPELDFIITSPQLTYEEYMNTPKKDVFINVMVGDLERIKAYPKLGYQIEQEIPAEVWQAWEYLVGQGYDKYRIK